MSVNWSNITGHYQGARADLNRDGQLNRAEVSNLAVGLLGSDNADSQAAGGLFGTLALGGRDGQGFFNDLDLDRNGSLNLNELQTLAGKDGNADDISVNDLRAASPGNFLEGGREIGLDALTQLASTAQLALPEDPNQLLTMFNVDTTADQASQADSGTAVQDSGRAGRGGKCKGKGHKKGHGKGKKRHGPPDYARASENGRLHGGGEARRAAPSQQVDATDAQEPAANPFTAIGGDQALTQQAPGGDIGQMLQTILQLLTQLIGQLGGGGANGQQQNGQQGLLALPIAVQ